MGIGIEAGVEIAWVAIVFEEFEPEFEFVLEVVLGIEVEVGFGFVTVAPGDELGGLGAEVGV